MVAFLQRLPELDAAAYRALAGAELQVEGAPPESALCIRCHGADGRGNGDGAFPRLDIQAPPYLFDALVAFRDGKRGSGFMQAAVAALDDTQLRTLADYFGRNVSAAPAEPAAPLPEGLPACAGCHGVSDPVRPQFPRLAGQYPDYLGTQLKLLAAKEHPRGGGPFVSLMQHVAKDLSEKQIAALVLHYAGESDAAGR
jgi:cytochrome c553